VCAARQPENRCWLEETHLPVSYRASETAHNTIDDFILLLRVCSAAHE
jgi:hypothetical protein